MKAKYGLRRTPELPPDNPSFIEERRRLGESVEAVTDLGEFPSRDYVRDLPMETYEGERNALFYE